jgi:RNA polymerase sigma-70 factor (ECF subfamily)
MMTDENLMLAFQGGDRSAMQELHRRHNRLIMHLSRRWSRTDAEDAAQETWLAACRGAHSWKPGNKWKAWMGTVARNVSIDRHRRQAARPLLTMADPPPMPVGPGETDALAARALGRQLGPAALEVITLGAVEGMDHNEMAAAMGCSPSTARARLSRALRTAREVLA